MTILRVKTARLAVLAVLSVLIGPFLFSQTDPDATPILRAAIEKIPPDNVKMRFTYFMREHSQNFNQEGKLISEITRLYEVIYIADLEYQRLVEVNGKPLAGQALADEQKRYDDAVRERTALDGAARAKLMHSRYTKLSSRFEDLVTKYHSTVVAHTQFGGRACLLIDAMPLGTIADAPRQHLRLWLDPQKSELLHEEFDLLGDEVDILRGSKGWANFTYMNGVRLTTEDHLEFILPVKNKNVYRAVSDHTLYNYRKFVSTSRILPAAEGNSPQ